MGALVIIRGGHGGRIREGSGCQGRESMKVSTWRDSPRAELLSVHYIPKVRAPRKEAEGPSESFGICGRNTEQNSGSLAPWASLSVGAVWEASLK